QTRLKAAHLIDWQVGAGRVVRVRKEDDLRAPGDGGQYGIDIGALVLLLRHDRRGACRQDLDAIDEKAVLRIDALVARPKIGLREQAQKLVRTVRTQDVGRVEPVDLGNRLAQAGGGTIRVKLQMAARRLDRLQRRRRGAERRLIG